jgi:N-acyl-D-amino-acid deacylase
MEQAIARIEAARAAGLPITADMYLYTASGTGLDSTLPGWVKEGGHKAMMERLADPASAPAPPRLEGIVQRDWSTVQPIGFKNPALRPSAGKRLPRSRRCAARASRRPRSIWCSRTTAGSAPSSTRWTRTI